MPEASFRPRSGQSPASVCASTGSYPAAFGCLASLCCSGETHTALVPAFGSSASPRQICGTEGDGSESAADEATEEPFAVAFAVNGTVNPPHRIWIYREESSPEKGICIHVDRFGEPKCEDFQ